MIGLNAFERQWSECGPSVHSAIERVGASGWYVLGQEVVRFEESFAAWWGLSHCVGVANGMDAMRSDSECWESSLGIASSPRH